MGAGTTSRNGMGNFLAWALILLIGAAALLMVGTGMENVPAAQPVNDHAIQKHSEAEVIWNSYKNKDFLCLRVYSAMGQNRLLYRLTYERTRLEGGIITTVAGKPVTAYLRTAASWDRIIVRDGFVLKAVGGDCEGVTQ